LFCNRSWEPRYGVDVLAEAFALAAKSKPELRLNLLAGGSEENRLREILKKNGAIDQVRFKGYISQEDLPHYYNEADVYISPSHVDGSSVSLMEAMGCGLPCLISDIPANKEWVTENENGWLFPDGDVDTLTKAILRVAEKRDTLDKIGAASRLVAERRADWSKNFEKLLEAYERTAALK
jgi:glycosyltransferase involved in cell wall biosynthesis